ncbi:MAG: ABC transporter permease, partial [Archangium sp.]
MSSAGAIDRFTESVGPIVVKEVRQGLRARVFAIFFGALLTVCFVIALVALGDVSGFAGPHAGRAFFASFVTALGGVTFFVIPFVAFRSMMRELEDETWVLLTLTGLGAHSITRGKWVSAMSQALLFSSACAPYVLFSYFLNGVDLVQLLVALLLAGAWSALLTAVAIAIATQAHSKLARTLAHFVVLGVLGVGTAMGVGFAWVLAEEGQRITSSVPFRNTVIGLWGFSLALTWLVLQCAAAGLALPSENASAGPRKALLLVALAGIVFAGVVFVFTNGRIRDAVPAQVLICMFLALSGVFASSERDGCPPQEPRGGRLKPGAER